MTPALQGWKSDTKSGGLGHCNYSYTCTPIQIYVEALMVHMYMPCTQRMRSGLWGGAGQSGVVGCGVRVVSA